MNVNSKFSLVLSLVAILFLHVACEKRSEYKQLVERELEKDVRNDSLFLGYHFGMERQDFFDHSWNLNQQGLITGGTDVEYQIDDLEHSATMSFFPEFHDDQIYKMPIEVQYDAWAPWNKNLFSDSLIVELVDRYEEIYGSGFIKTMHPKHRKESWVKVDGNREISIFKKDDMQARIVFLDLTVDRESP